MEYLNPFLLPNSLDCQSVDEYGNPTPSATPTLATRSPSVQCICNYGTNCFDDIDCCNGLVCSHEPSYNICKIPTDEEAQSCIVEVKKVLLS